MYIAYSKLVKGYLLAITSNILDRTDLNIIEHKF